MSGERRAAWMAVTLGALVVLLAAGSAAAERLGDFGRAPFAHVTPDYPTSRHPDSDRASLLLADEEIEMNDRFWRFLIVTDGSERHDWNYLREKRGAAAPRGDWRGSEERYFRWLKTTRYASSHTRFSTIADDVLADLGTLPATFAAICTVRDLDDRRAVALAGLAVDRRTSEGMALRRGENERAIGWFVAALQYRFKSYGYALDHLLVETPHVEARRADDALNELAPWVAAAQRGGFCDGVGATFAGRDGGRTIPGRVLMGDHERVEQK